MGNKLARTTQASASEYYLQDLPTTLNLVLKESLGKGRFLKSIVCVHDEGWLVVKVYFKRGEFPDVKAHERKLKEIKEKLKDIKHSHVWPFQHWMDTDKAAYLIRQYFYSNLHDRMSTRPFLSIIEKKWLAFQLLHAVKQSHEHKVCHGDIKCENVLVTSWNWVYLADYACFKPTYLPADNPADFSFFFDTGGSRRCYLAPERFCDQVPAGDGPLQPSMDVFSLGCVIAELFLEGQAIFTLSQLLMYRRGEYDPRPSLEKVPDSGIREMVLHMIQQNPESRLSAHEYLETWAPTLFPSYFSPLLHNFFSCIVPLDPDTRVAVTQGAFPEIRKQMLADAKRKVEGKRTGERHARLYSGRQKDVPGGQHAFAGSNHTHGGDGGAIGRRYGRSKTISGDSHVSLLSDINALLRNERMASDVGLPSTGVASQVRSFKDEHGERDDVLDKFSKRSLGRARSVNITLSGIPTKGSEAKLPLGVIQNLGIVDESFALDIGHVISDVQVPTTSGSQVRIKPASLAMADAALAVEEVIVEEVYENQVREPGGTFSEWPFSPGESSESGVKGAGGRQKGDITLPLESGWMWEGDWEVDLNWLMNGVGVDREGWRYRKVVAKDLEKDVRGNAAAAQGEKQAQQKLGVRQGLSQTWTAACTPDCTLRRRRWLRKRRKRLPTPVQVPIKSGSMQVAGGSIDSLMVAKSPEQGSESKVLRCEGMVLIASLLCSCLRNVRLPQARRGAVQLLQDASEFCDDDCRLQQIIPYVAALLSDSAAIVRCAALQTLCNVLAKVSSFPPGDAKLFPEYILPLLSMLPDDPEESVRIAYSDNISLIAETADRCLKNSQYISDLGGLDSPSRAFRFHTTEKPPLPSVHQHTACKIENELSQLREALARVIQELVIGQKQTPTIRRALLTHVGSLCKFFGQKQSNDFLLPILPAFLNDRDEQLRSAFFEHIIHVCLFIGQMSVEAYLLPYVEQALSDVEEIVVVNSLNCLAALCCHRMLRKRVLLEAVERAAPLLCHPSQWVRKAAITFVAATSCNLDIAEAYSLLSPILSPFLRREPASLCSEEALMPCLKPPMSREAFNRLLSDIMLLENPSDQLCTKVVHQRKGNSSEQLCTKVVQQRKGRQRSPSQSQVKPLERSRFGKEADISSATADSRGMKNLGSKLPSLQGLTSCFSDGVEGSESGDGEKLKAMEGYIRNLSSTMQTRMHNWEVENTEKLQSSALGLATGVGTGYYSHYDGTSEGIPLYWVSVNEKKQDGPTKQDGQAVVFDASPSSNEEWSRIFGARQGNVPYFMTAVAGTPMGSSLAVASSQWATIGATHSSMVPADPYQSSVSMTGSVYNGGHFMYDVTKDTYRRDGDGNVLRTSIKAVPVASLDSFVQGQSGPSADVLVDQDPTMEALGERELEGSNLDTSWRPRGVLIAHLQEHQQAVNEVAVSSDSVFFLSGSDDGTVKVWDCRRLERDISFRSRLTYGCKGGRVLHVQTFGSDHKVAAATSDGVIHVFNVDYVGREGSSAEKYSGFSEIRKLESQEGPVTSLQNFCGEGTQLLLYSTLKDNIHLWDMRKQVDAWSLCVEPAQGYVTATALDFNCNWLVSATSRGFLTLWDLRFLIPVNTWCHPSGCFIKCMSPLQPWSWDALKPSRRPLVYVAAGRNELALWNAEDGNCLQVLQMQGDTAASETHELPAALKENRFNTDQIATPKERYKVEELIDPPPQLPGVRALLPLSGGASIICGGTDLRIRLWDRLRPGKSYCVCGPTVKGPTAPDSQVYSTTVISGVRVVQEHPPLDGSSSSKLKTLSKPSIVAAATDTAGCHRDCITSLALAQTNQRLLISSSRDGAVKVWK